MLMVQKACLALLISRLASLTEAQRPADTTVTDKVLAADSNEYSSFNSGHTIEEVVASGKELDPSQDNFLIRFHPHEEAPPGHAAVATPLSQIKTLTFNSDAVLLARPLSCRSAPTASHTFIFSDCETKIDTVYLDSSGQLATGGELVVSRPGATLVVNGAKVTAVETEFPRLRPNGQYLLFLHKLPSGSYYVGPSDAFSFEGNIVKSVRNHPTIDVGPYTPEQIQNAIRAAVEERR